MKTKKRLLSILLSLVMVLGVMPGMSMTAYAADGNVAKVGDTEYPTFAEALQNWNDGSTLTLLADVTTADTISMSSGTKTFNLNGKNITKTGETGSVFCIRGGNLTVNGTGTISGGKGMNDGENQDYFRGGGFYISNAEVTVTNATISGNQALWGGGVFVGGTGTFTMNNGTISANQSKSYSGWTSGGGVWIEGNGTFIMNGGTVTGNTAEDHIGGVHANSGTFKVSGAAVITGNTHSGSNSNVKGNITVIGTLTEDANIGVTMDSPGVFTNSENTTYNIASKFTSDDTSYAVGKNTNGQLYLGDAISVTFDTNGHGTAPDAQSVVSGSTVAKPSDPTTEGYTFGGWYKEAACTNAWDFANDTVTAATTLYAKWTAVYEVTYKVVGGTWSDGSTTDKQETVQNGAKPASVPTGMKASEGYTGGAWDTDPASATITGTKTFTYTFTAKQAATVTKAPEAKTLTYTGSAQELVTAGTASGGTMQYAIGENSTTAPADNLYTTSIPSKTDAGTYYVWYKAVGSGNYKDSVPVCITVSIKKEDDSQNKGATDEKVEQHADTPETTVSGVSDELTDAVANSEEKAAVAAGSKATFTFELTNADNTVPAAEKQSLENVVRNEAPNAIVGMLLDLKAFFQVGNMPKRQLDTLNGKTVTFNFKVPEKLHAPTGIKRTFFILQNHGGKISILARTTATNIPFSAGDFSTYALAYSDENTDQEGFNTSIKIKQSEGKIKVSWDQVNGVSKVKVFATYCGKDYPSKPVKTTKGNSVTIKKLNGKKLNLKKNFKLYLVAYDKDGNKIGKTPSAHFAGKNSDKYTNPKSIKVSNKNVSVAVGANVKVKATIKLEDKKRKELPQKHAEKFRYRSTKNYIATVDKKGNIKGIAPGTCTVYVYAKNGLAKKVTVTVN